MALAVCSLPDAIATQRGTWGRPQRAQVTLHHMTRPRESWEQRITRLERDTRDVATRLPADVDIQINKDYLDATGFTRPILAPSRQQVDMQVPPPNMTLQELEKTIGSDRVVRAIDVAGQRELLETWTLREWMAYFATPRAERTRVLNLISLECSGTKLERMVRPPSVVQEIGWVERHWPKKNKRERDEMPRVQLYCLMSAATSYTEFHVDFGGSSVWYHLYQGRKYFFVIPPTDANQQLFLNWENEYRRDTAPFFGDLAAGCGVIEMHAGDTLLLPSGWIHAVYTPEDSISFGGNFLSGYHMASHLSCHARELTQRVEQRFLFPQLEQVVWHAAVHYASVLASRPSTLSKWEWRGLSVLVPVVEAWWERQQNEASGGDPAQIAMIIRACKGRTSSFSSPDRMLQKMKAALKEKARQEAEVAAVALAEQSDRTQDDSEDKENIIEVVHNVAVDGALHVDSAAMGNDKPTEGCANSASLKEAEPAEECGDSENDKRNEQTSVPHTNEYLSLVDTTSLSVQQPPAAEDAPQSAPATEQAPFVASDPTVDINQPNDSLSPPVTGESSSSSSDHASSSSSDSSSSDSSDNDEPNDRSNRPAGGGQNGNGAGKDDEDTGDASSDSDESDSSSDSSSSSSSESEPEEEVDVAPVPPASAPTKTPRVVTSTAAAPPPPPPLPQPPSQPRDQEMEESSSSDSDDDGEETDPESAYPPLPPAPVDALLAIRREAKLGELTITPEDKEQVIQLARQHLLDRQRGVKQRKSKSKTKSKTKASANGLVVTIAKWDEDEWMVDCMCGFRGKNVDDGLKMVQCGNCENWLHVNCIGEPIADEFWCYRCKDLDDWMFSCICGKKQRNFDDMLPMVQCEKCATWQHMGCMQITGAAPENYRCQPCSAPVPKPKTPRTPKTPPRQRKEAKGGDAEKKAKKGGTGKKRKQTKENGHGHVVAPPLPPPILTDGSLAAVPPPPPPPSSPPPPSPRSPSATDGRRRKLVKRVDVVDDVDTDHDDDDGDGDESDDAMASADDSEPIAPRKKRGRPSLKTKSVSPVDGASPATVSAIVRPPLPSGTSPEVSKKRKQGGSGGSGSGTTARARLAKKLKMKKFRG